MGKWLTGDTLPDGNTCRAVQIPNEASFRRAFLGALSLLTQAENWEQHGTLTPEEQAYAFLEAFWDVDEDICLDQIYPTEANLNPAIFFWGGVTPNPSQVTASMPYGLYTFTATGATGDYCETRVMLKAGTYKIKTWYFRGTDCGIIRMYVNGVGNSWVLDQSLGAAGVRIYETTFVIPYDGEHLLQFTINEKHAAATSYRFRLGAIKIYP